MILRFRLDTRSPTLSVLALQILLIVDLSAGRKMVNYNPKEMGRSEIIDYFGSTLLTKFSSLDKVNENAYIGDSSAVEDLYYSIDNLMPRTLFVKHLIKTKNITDKIDGRGASLLTAYRSDLNQECHKNSVFKHTVPEILQKWDGDRSIIYNDLEYWHIQNQFVSHFQLCNRFKGLTCQYRISPQAKLDGGLYSEPSENTTCQCSGESKNVGYFKKVYSPNKTQAKFQYPDGCYVRPWRPCRHLSLDFAFRETYYNWHKSLANQKAQLAQMIFPVGRQSRCKEGTYCLDMIPGMKKPVCWCTQDSIDPLCQDNVQEKNPQKRIPLGTEFTALRKSFLKMFIPANDTLSGCNPDANIYAEQLISASGKDPTGTGAIRLMKELLHNFTNADRLSPQGQRLCDFREQLFCNPETKTCQGKLSCGPGKIHLSQGVCAVNNGFRCQSQEDCVEKAKCTKLKGTTDSFCVCETGYGDRCGLENPAFFSKFFLPVLSGFQGDRFIRLQENISTTLESWEDNMKQHYGDTCDTGADKQSMEIVQFFQSLNREKYDVSDGEKLLQSVPRIIRDAPKLCYYTKFLRCHSQKRKCIPMMGSRVVSYPPSFTSNPSSAKDNTKVYVEFDPGEECGKGDIPAIFRDAVVPVCTADYYCDAHAGEGTCKPDCNSPVAPKHLCTKIELGSKGRGILDVPGGRHINVTANATVPSTNMTTMPPSTIMTTMPSTTPNITVSTSVAPVTTVQTGTLSTISANQTTTLPGSVSAVNSTVGVTSPVSPMPLPNTYSPTDPPPLPTFAEYDNPCEFSVNTAPSLDAGVIKLTCNGDKLLTCIEGICKCLPTMKYSFSGDCRVPIGDRCDEASVKLPRQMNYGNVKCEFGVCKQDSARLICRPESDHMLILVSFPRTKKI